MSRANPIRICGDGEGFRITVEAPAAVFTARSISIRQAPFHPGRLLRMGDGKLVSGEVQLLTQHNSPNMVYYVPVHGETPSATLKHFVMRNP